MFSKHRWCISLLRQVQQGVVDVGTWGTVQQYSRAQSISSQQSPSTSAADDSHLGLSKRQQNAVKILSSYNITLPHLWNQTIVAKVVEVQRSRVLVDSGYFGLSGLSRRLVNLSHLHAPQGKPTDRSSASDIRPGDQLKVRLVWFFTPYGAPKVALSQSGAEVQQRQIWEELQEAMDKNHVVKGRILNTCPGGYAVGVAGVVAKLPHSQASGETTQKIGVLQPFFVTRVDQDRKLVELCDPKYKPRRDRVNMGNLYSNI